MEEINIAQAKEGVIGPTTGPNVVAPSLASGAKSRRQRAVGWKVVETTRKSRRGDLPMADGPETAPLLQQYCFGWITTARVLLLLLAVLAVGRVDGGWTKPFLFVDATEGELTISNHVARTDSVSERKRFVILGRGNDHASKPLHPSGFLDDAEDPRAHIDEQRTEVLVGISSVRTSAADCMLNGGVIVGETDHTGDAHVTSELAHIGDELRTVEAARQRQECGSLLRSVPPALHLENGKSVLNDKAGRRTSLLDASEDKAFHHDIAARADDDKCDNEDLCNGAAGNGRVGDGTEEGTLAGNRSFEREHRKESLKEWAAEARKSRRMNPPLSPQLDSFTKRHEQHTPADNNSSSSSKDSSKDSKSRSGINSNNNGSSFPSFAALEHARARALKGLLAGNATETLELCHEILQEWPTDSGTLLYQGIAMAQTGEWEIAWTKMERILALSHGVEEVEPATADAVDRESARLTSATGSPRTSQVVPLDTFLAASVNLASFARARSRQTIDMNAEAFFLVEGLRGAAERDSLALAGNEAIPARPSRSSRLSSEPRNDEKSAENESEREPDTESPSGKSSREGGDGDNRAGEEYTFEHIGGFTNVLIKLAQALEGKGQLTSALRLYQRAILLGGHHDQTALNGLGGLSRRLPQVELERPRRHSITLTGLPRKFSLPSMPKSPTPPPTGDHYHQDDQRHTIAGASAFRQRAQGPGRGCDWAITHPRQGQVFSPEELIQVEFDLTLLDPGLPSAGSLFETIAIGDRDLFSEDYMQKGCGDSIGRVIDDGLGFVVCSYLEQFKAAACLPRAQLQDVELGWHLLTAEAYQLPSLTPFSCPILNANVEHDVGEYSTRTVRFCVGDATTTCREAGGEYVPGSQTDTADATAASTRHPVREDNAPFPEETSVEVPDSSSTSAKDNETSKVEDHRRGGATSKARTKKASSLPDKEADAGVDVELPFCFMTLALNAMPFITHHAPTFDKVGEILSERSAIASAADVTAHNRSTTFRNARSAGADNVDRDPASASPTPPARPAPESFWEWHVAEGVAAGRASHGSPYSRRRIPDHFFDPAGLSVDGTTQHLDDIVANSVDVTRPSFRRKRRVHVHRRCGSGRARPTGGARSYNSEASNSTRIPAAGTAGRETNTNGSDEGDGVRSSCLWRDKIQMVNTVAFSIEKECLLVQIDADELWTAEQLVQLRDMFLHERNEDDGESRSVEGRGEDERRSVSGSHNREGGGHTSNDQLGSDEHKPLQRHTKQQQHQIQDQHHSRKTRKRECAYFDCHFFVGPDLMTVTEDGWGHSSSNEWLRAWVFQPRESVWLQHSPPELARYDEATGWTLLAGDKCIGREETREQGLVFTHYAYVLEEQVRFKDEFYGHSEMAATADNSTTSATSKVGAVAEWQALQTTTPPVLLADHLTWLRVQGNTQDPRLLATVADRPMSSFSTHIPRQWPQRHGGGGDKGGVSVPSEPEMGSVGGGGWGGDQHEDDITSGGAEVPYPTTALATPFAAPLDPFLQLAEADRHRDSTFKGVRHRASGDHDTGEARTSLLNHGVHTGMKEYDTGRGRRLGPVGRVGDEQGRTGRTTVAHKCGTLHLVVDGVTFQVHAAKPQGITRVWMSVLPAILGRLNEFEGTCLTLLVRGLAPPPLVIEEALSRLPPERFAVVHLPLYNPLSGYVADGLMLSWAVRSAAATAFVSTLYTQPLWATTPNVARLLLVHDLLPEVLGWDMSRGEWLQKANAVAVASHVVTVSQYTAKEFMRMYQSEHSMASATTPRPVWVAHNGVDTSVFRPRGTKEANSDSDYNGGGNKNDEFRRLAGLDPGTPYVMIVGSRNGYKNARGAYIALGLASTPTSTATSNSAASGALALVLVGGGPVTPEELELLAEVSSWSHIGVGSGIASAAIARGAEGGSGGGGGVKAGEVAVVDDNLLAQGYSGAKALLHLSLAEGFGLTALEAFACGCPVIAVDIPPIREIAGLPDLEEDKAGKNEGAAPVAAESVRGNHEQSRASSGGDSRTSGGTRRYDGASSPLEGGLVLVANPSSATQVWRAVRAIVVMDEGRRSMASEALVRRARVFNSWQPLADTLINAAVE